MKNFKLQFAVILLSSAALMTACRSNQTGCYYGATDNQEAQEIQNTEKAATLYVVQSKDIEVAE